VKVIATAKSVRITSRKARLVADSVIGLPVAEALAVLSFTPRHAAKEVAKVIKSAAANAEHNYNLEASSLRVERIDVDQAGMMKRFIPKPRGMAGSIFKRMSHLRCYVTDEEPEPDRRRRSVVAMPGRSGGQGSTRPAATRRRRPAQLRRAQEAATAAAAAEEEATTAAAAGEEALEVPATSAGDEIETSETDALDPGAAEADAGEAEADAAQDDEEKD
jgi:large subunit ribosomal protein L22